MKKKAFALLRGIAAFLVWAVLMAALLLFLLIFGVTVIPDEESTAMPLWYFFAALFASAFGSALIIRRCRRKRARRRGESTPGEEYDAVSEDLPECSPVSAPVVPAPPAPAYYSRYSPRRFTVFNAQTTGKFNDRICSIGLARIRDGRLVSCDNIYVNPECSIAPDYSEHHGVTSADVCNEPTLPSVWAKIQPLFYDAVIVSHNAPFHLAVLSKALDHYGITPPPVRYLDTLAMSRAKYKQFRYHNLRFLCACLRLTPVQAGAYSHARSTADLLLQMKPRTNYRRFIAEWDFKTGLYYDTYISGKRS